MAGDFDKARELPPLTKPQSSTTFHRILPGGLMGIHSSQFSTAACGLNAVAVLAITISSDLSSISALLFNLDGTKYV